MSKPKILVFAPREEPPETIAALEGLGCELVFGGSSRGAKTRILGLDMRLPHSVSGSCRW